MTVVIHINSMRRRNFFILCSSTCGYLAGCASSPGSTSTTAAMTDDPADFDEQYLEIRNRAENKESLSLIVQGSDSVITKGEYGVAADQTIYVPLQITEKGNYELTVSRSGGTEVSKTLVIGEYELGHGPNVVIELRDEEMEIYQLE
jgi:outer membrane PBP1 activator LpoA protein